MDFKNLVVASWHHTLNFIGPVLLVTFVQVLLIFFSLGILAPVTTAGYVHSLLRAARDGRPPEVKDLFSQMRLFFPLLVFFLVALVPIVLGFLMLVLPGLIMLALIAYGAFYLLPLMTDRELGLFDGLKESWDMVMQAPISDHIIVVIIYIAIISLGSYVPFAFLITQPLATFIMVGAYQEKVAGFPEPRDGDQGDPGNGGAE